MSVQVVQGSTIAMSSEQESLAKILGYSWIAMYKISWLMSEKGAVLDDMDEEVATLTGPDGVCEVNLYGEVRWI